MGNPRGSTATPTSDLDLQRRRRRDAVAVVAVEPVRRQAPGPQGSRRGRDPGRPPAPHASRLAHHLKGPRTGRDSPSTVVVSREKLPLRTARRPPSNAPLLEARVGSPPVRPARARARAHVRDAGSLAASVRRTPPRSSAVPPHHRVEKPLTRGGDEDELPTPPLTSARIGSLARRHSIHLPARTSRGNSAHAVHDAENSIVAQSFKPTSRRERTDDVLHRLQR